MHNSLKLGGQPLNATMEKFGAPGTCIQTYQHWSLLLRPAQVTLGALVLVAHEPVSAFSQLGRESFTELHTVTRDVEQSLKRAFEYEKINYLMLMMVDPDVHFHVIPRYSGTREFAGQEFIDPGWPGPPALDQINETDDACRSRIKDSIGSFFS